MKTTRYVRQYGADFSRDPRKDTTKQAWALFERFNGKSKRVGRTDSAYHYMAFIFCGPVEQKFLRNA